MARFEDRRAGGRALAEQLARYAGRADVQVLGLPRGGVPVAYEVARALGAPLDVFIVRKIGMPGHEEFAIGALAAGGVQVLNEDVIDSYDLSRAQVQAIIDREEKELERRQRLFRGNRPPPRLSGETVILVDDGLATGSTMRAAVSAIRAQHPSRLVVATPVGAPETCEAMKEVADEVICAVSPAHFLSVGSWYDDFTQTTDDEVRALLAAAGPEAPEETQQEVAVPIEGGQRLVGTLTIPSGARGLVLFAHGSGSSRLSPRNRYVADALNDAGLATLLIDLLTTEEEPIDRYTRHLRFDIGLLARRLESALDWLADDPRTCALPVGAFGASTGAAAALIAAAYRPEQLTVVVSRGGRPDLADAELPRVRAPTLLIVGDLDEGVLELNERAHTRLGGEKELYLVEGATHLSEEPGTLEEVARIAARYFIEHLGRNAAWAASTGLGVER